MSKAFARWLAGPKLETESSTIAYVHCMVCRGSIHVDLRWAFETLTGEILNGIYLHNNIV